MSLSVTTNKVQYAPNGATTVFAFAVPFLANSHVVAVLTTNGVDATLSQSGDYTVTGAGGPSGGNVTCAVAPAAGTVLTIKRVVPYTQLATYVANTAFPAQSHEQALDLLTMAVQQLAEQMGRCLQFQDGSTVSISAVLPSVPTRANKKLAFDANGALTAVA